MLPDVVHTELAVFTKTNHSDEEHSKAANSAVLAPSGASSQPEAPSHHPHHSQKEISDGEREYGVNLKWEIAVGIRTYQKICNYLRVKNLLPSYYRYHYRHST